MKTTILTSLIFGGLCFGSCQNVDESIPDKGPVSAKLSSLITRAIGNSWSVNDRIGVFMTDGGTATNSVFEDADNISYTVTAAGTEGVFSPTTATQVILLPEDDSNVTFVAYYPYSPLTNDVFAIDLKDQSNQETLDVMTAIVGNVSESSPNVILKFSRALSKMVINVSSKIYTPEQMATLKVRITGLKGNGTFNPLNSALTSSTPKPIATKSVTAGSLYEAILFPGDIAPNSAVIEFVIGAETLTYTIPAASFKAAERYTYNLELTQTKVNSLSTTISDWIDDPMENNGTAENKSGFNK